MVPVFQIRVVPTNWK